MNESKYRFIYEDFKDVEVDGKIYRAYRIISLKEFENLGTKTNGSKGVIIQKGELGGYVTENTLAQNGSSWLDEGSIVVSTGSVPCVIDDAFVSYSNIKGNFLLRENGKVSYSTIVSGNKNYTEISGNALVVDSLVGCGDEIVTTATFEKNNFSGASFKASNNTNISNCKIAGKVEIFGKSQIQSCNIKSDKNNILTINLATENPWNYCINDKTITESVIMDNTKYQKKNRNTDLFGTPRTLI